MKFSTTAAVSCAVVVLATAAGEAWSAGRGGSHGGGARPSHSHSHTRVFVGGSFYYGPYWYPAPYYYYPPPPAPYVEPQPPAVYIEQGQDPESQVWYYCQSAHAYYPYTDACPEGWQRVVPDLPQQSPSG